MLRQYYDIKKKYKDAVLLFRVGDFYECYDDDALILANCCKIILTSKGYGTKKMKMSGVPHHSVNKYIKMLISNGYKVAICDQIEDASKKSGPVVQRKVTRVITPGTITDLMMLEDGTNNYLVGINKYRNEFGLVFVDISTGEFFGTQIKGENKDDLYANLISELVKFSPAECILPEKLYEDTELLDKLKKYTTMAINKRNNMDFDVERSRDILLEHFKVMNLVGFGCEDKPAIISSAGAILLYLKEIQMSEISIIKNFSIYNRNDYMIIDAASQRNLELVRSIMEDSTKGTLLSILDKTVTPMGSRKLKKWIKQPLKDIKLIKYRQEMINQFKEDLFLRDDIRKCLKEIYDIERLIGKISHDSANAKDLVFLRSSLEKIPEIIEILNRQSGQFKEFFNVEIVERVLKGADLIKRAIKDEPATTLHEGGIIRKGFNQELDELLEIRDQGKDFLIKLEARERARTGITTRKRHARGA